MKLKKIITLAMTVAMVLSFSSMACAAELTADEKAFLNKVKAGYAVGDKTITVDAQYITELEKYLAENDVTATEIKEIEKNIDAAVAVVKEAGVSKIDDLTTAQKNKVMEYVKAAGKVENLTVNLSADGKISVTDAEGKKVAEVSAAAKITGEAAEDDTIKKTGFGLEATAAVVTLLAVAVVSCAIVSKRRSIAA